MTGHDVDSHYRGLVAGGQVRRRLGDEEHLRLVETALCTDIDHCSACFDIAVSDLAAEPMALLAARRVCALLLGVYEGVATRGSPEEAADFQAIIENPETARNFAAELIRFCVMHMAGGQQRPSPQQRRRRGKRQRVRHPSRRVRDGQRRRPES